MLALAFIAWAAPRAAEAAPFHGAIYTTTDDCGDVNENVGYASKLDVYLNGGPQGNSNRGLPDGNYWVRVTEPNGTVLGTSTSAIAVASGGSLEECYQLWDILEQPNGDPGYADTSNNGGVYKVWLCQTAAFSPSTCKTDNFKVREDRIPPPPELGTCDEGEGRIVIHFNQTLLNGDPETATVAVDIPAGTYKVTLASFDNHDDKPDQDQEVERWFLLFFYDGPGSETSNSISDLPENQNTLEEYVGTVDLEDDVDGVRAQHHLIGQFFPTAESVKAVCALLEPVNR